MIPIRMRLFSKNRVTFKQQVF